MIRLAAALLAASTAFAATPATPKNVILLIADGAGLAHYTLLKNSRGNDFQLSRLPVVGLATTRCLDRAVTDSAAGATAIATGSKVTYEAVSQDPEGKPLTTALEVAEAAGKATGLVTTSYFYDATVASFASHAKNRNDYAGIVTQMLQSGAEVIAGTALKPMGEGELTGVPELAKQQGYTIVSTRAELDAAPEDTKILTAFPKQVRDLDYPDAPLPVLAKFAIDRLKTDPDGFFLVLENEGTDGSSHQNYTADVTAALTSFDTTVGIALDFAAASGDTLVLVTSDHETGGMRVSNTEAKRFRVEWSTTDHTGTAVPVFAYGPGSMEFAGFYDNTDTGKKLLKLVGR
jgi:alkaline phosphatase